MKEIWKDIPYYEGHYQMNLNQEVKSLERKVSNGNGFRIVKERILKPYLDTYGYLCVFLSKNSVVKTYKVHQLMMVTFKNHKPCGFKLVIDHINFIRTDNRLKNLRIVTTRENTNQKHLKSSSEYTGVSWIKSDKKWKATIVINGKNKHLGIFNNEYDASIYYKNALKCVINDKISDIKVKRPNYTSNFTGISFNKRHKKWISAITINKKKKYLGYFIEEYDAHLAYQKELKLIT